MTQPLDPPPSNLHEWRPRLAYVVDTMRQMSLISDPQATVRAYRRRVAQLIPSDRFVALSRRGLPPPRYHITRTDLWKEEVNPWKEKSKLPTLEGGLLGELLYGDEPRLIDDLSVAADDPAYEYLQGQRSLIALPTYDQGVAMNMTVLMRRVPHGFDADRFPELVWQSNLFGRYTNNLVLADELRRAWALVDRELQAVAAIQRSLLPVELPRVPGLGVAASYQTSQQAGGDYYDFFPLPDGRWGVFVADVSGHGTPAAVVMAVTHAIAHSFPGPPAPPNQMLSFLNHKLFEPYASGSGTFVTAFYGVYDPAARHLVYSSAGHNPPRLRRAATGRVSALDDAQCLPLGLSPQEVYLEREVQLARGDQVVLYTDGITEARNAAGDMWGVEGLDAAIQPNDCRAQTALQNLLASLAAFTGPTPASDDQTLVVMQIE